LVRLQTLLDNPIKLAQMPPELKLEVRAVHACSPTTEVAEARLIYYEKLKAGCCFAATLGSAESLPEDIPVYTLDGSYDPCPCKNATSNA